MRNIVLVRCVSGYDDQKFANKVEYELDLLQNDGDTRVTDIKFSTCQDDGIPMYSALILAEILPDEDEDEEVTT